MISSREFTWAKPASVFVNTARGELVDEQALAYAINNGQLAGAAIDLLQDEQENMNAVRPLSPLRKLAAKKQIIMTPHIGGNTHESRPRTEEFLAAKLVTLSCAQSCTNGGIWNQQKPNTA